MIKLKKVISMSICISIALNIFATQSNAVNFKQVVPPKYDYVSDFKEGLAAVKSGEKVGYIDKTGKQVIPLKYDYDYDEHDEADILYDFSEGLALVKLGDKYGYINKTGKQMIPFKYEYASDFSDGLAFVSINGKGSYINRTGKEVIQSGYDYGGIFNEGLARVSKTVGGVQQWGYINKTGKEVIPLKYSSVSNFSEGLAEVSYDSLKVGYIDKTGKQVTPHIYNYNFESYFYISYGPNYGPKFSEGLSRVSTGDEQFYIDKTGKQVMKPNYNWFSDFSEGLAMAEDQYGWGYIDKTGNETIALQYSHARDFSEGLAAVEKGGEKGYMHGKWGYIDKTGKEVIPFIYEYASDFSEGLAAVLTNGKWGYISKDIINVYLNNNKLEMSVSPMLKEGRTLVPLRAIFEAMGAEVKWNQGTKTVTGIKDNTTIVLQLGNKTAKINGSDVNLDVPAIVVNGSTLVPARFVAESLGAEVNWDGNSNSVLIKTKN